MQRRASILFVVFLLVVSSAHAQFQQCPGGWVTDAGILKCRCSDGSFADLASGVPVCKEGSGGVVFVPEPEQEQTEAPLPYPKLGLKISVAPEGQTGVLIAEVEPGSEADAKSIRAGSIITSVNTATVTDPADVVANVARAYRDGRGAVLMKIDGHFVAIPFSDRKGQRLAQREAPPVLRAEPRLAQRPAERSAPRFDVGAPLAALAPQHIEASAVQAWSALTWSSWLPLVLAALTGALLAPLATRGYRLAVARARPSADMVAIAAPREHNAVAAPAPVPRSPAPLPTAPVAVRDTPGALNAMRLAVAYIEELENAGTPDPENKADRQSRLNTLSLATKQLNAAERLDPRRDPRARNRRRGTVSVDNKPAQGAGPARRSHHAPVLRHAPLDPASLGGDETRSTQCRRLLHPG